MWDATGGNVQLLPPLPGDTETWAYAINNDMVILGRSGSTWISHTVIWLQSPAGWTVQQVLGGIEGLDLDQGIGVVGRTGQNASYGRPDHAGFFNTIGPSIARAVSRKGDAAGDDEGASPGWPTVTVAFVADRSGTTTYLPLPTSQTWRASFGQGVNSCGLVVGAVWEFPGAYFSAQPVVWDPGC